MNPSGQMILLLIGMAALGWLLARAAIDLDRGWIGRLAIACWFAAIVVGFAGVCGTRPAHAQSLDGARERHTTAPDYRGRAANAPIPASMHWRNQGGSDGSGLCVISSLKINGNYQGVPGLDRLWTTAKSRPGGYSPGKLQGLLDEVMPEEKWASYVGTDPTVLHKLSGMGYPIGSTMNTGELYGWAPIHHMISLVHFDRERDLACVVDNNQPGVYSWMTSREYLRRWVDGGTGWAFVWLREVPGDAETVAVAVFVLACGAVLACVLLIPGRRAVPAAAAPSSDWSDPDGW